MQIEELSIIVFTKDRPLQLQGYLDSLIYFSNINQTHITVLYKHNPKISYQELTNKYASINWVKEENFYVDLKNIINRSNDFIMFGCDDVIFKDNIDLSFAISFLVKRNDMFGFSLRLGENIKPLPAKLSKFHNHLEWNWRNEKVNHWNYPWELDATIYRKNDVVEIFLKLNSEIIRNPNYFESEVSTQLDKFIVKDKLASFRKGKCIVLTVNRVQDDFVNDYDHILNTDVGSMYKLYKKGCTIDYIAISKKENSELHVGIEFLKLAGKNNPFKFLSIMICLKKIKKFLNRIRSKLSLT